MLFRGGLRDAEWLVVECAELDMVGLGVEDILMAEAESSCDDMSDISSLTTVILFRYAWHRNSSCVERGWVSESVGEMCCVGRQLS